MAKRAFSPLPRPAVAPSILSADFAHLADEIARVEAAGADLLHLDIMDGHFVPNLTIGPAVVAKIRSATKLLLDVHLMIEEPARYIQAFAEAGADHLTFHAEVVSDPEALAGRIRDLGCTVGVTVNPDQPAERLQSAIPHVDMVLMMTVFAGFAGQEFIADVMPKVRQVRAWLRPEQRLEVDGGITPKTAGIAAAAGADIFVAGTGVFRAGAGDYAANIAAIRQAAVAAGAGQGTSTGAAAAKRPRGGK